MSRYNVTVTKTTTYHANCDPLGEMTYVDPYYDIPLTCAMSEAGCDTILFHLRCDRDDGEHDCDDAVTNVGEHMDAIAEQLHAESDDLLASDDIDKREKGLALKMAAEAVDYASRKTCFTALSYADGPDTARETVTDVSPEEANVSHDW